MAITNAQQFKQLVNPPRDGKRPGYRGDDAGRSGQPGYASPPSGTPQGDGPETGAQFGSDKRALEKQDFFTQSYTGPERFGGLIGGYKDTQVPNTTQYGNKSLLGSLFSRFGPFDNKAFFDTKVVPSLLDKGRTPPSFKDYMTDRMAGKIDAYGNPIDDDDDDTFTVLPVDTTFAQTPRTEEQEPEVEEPFQLSRRFRAEGGIMNSDVVGGEFDFESARQMYGLGKLVKKVTKTVKKIAKSPIGKAALLYAGTAGLGSLGAGGGFGSLFKLGTYAPATVKANLGTSFARFMGGKLAPNLVDEVALTGKQNLFQRALGSIPGGGVTAAIAGVSALAGLMTPEQEEEAQELSRGEGIDIEAARRSIIERAQGNITGDLRARRFRAEGGSMKEPVAKKTMPLLDMDGKEMDLREEGGFVPIGRMEKADDVPARLSKNEFVFTADAVRNAGDGDVDKGAEVMYNMMKNLESGGDVSEESQGLEGARKMFQTSQRLEEVL